MKTETLFKGAATALITPLTKDGVDYPKMKELLDMGILTQEEFDAKKAELLGL